VADAGRVIAGTARGIRLMAPGEGTRPLSDRVKQALFGILEPDLPGARFLDLFAGSGAAGIEALSRGAASAVFVERDGDAVRVIAENLRRTGMDDARATVVRAEAIGWLGRGGQAAERAAGPFAVVMLDPPYADPAALEAALAGLAGPTAPLAPDARVIAKHYWRTPPTARVGLLASERERRFGDTTLTFYRRTNEESP
jgi:16S rRNA (guanine(966)-N(2))-methyltransferase RsmD